MIWLIILFPLVFLIVDFWIERKLYSPTLVFNGIFFITLFLYNFKMSYIQQDLSTRTMLLLFFCELGFNIPAIVSYLLKVDKIKNWVNSLLGKIKKNKVTNKENENSLDDETKNVDNKANSQEIEVKETKNDSYCVKDFELNKKLELCIFIMILLMFIVQIIYSKSLPLISKFKNDGKTYMDFGIPSLTGLFYSFVIIMGAYSLFRKGNYYKYAYLLIGILIISRQLILSILIEGCVLKLITTKKLSKKLIITLSIFGVVAVLGFSIIGNFRTGESEFLRVAKFKECYDWVPTAIKWIYSYACFSVSNLNKLVGLTLGGVNYGITCFNFLMPSIFQFNIESKFTESYLVSENFTVSTFIPELYLDFGIVGVALFCFVIGVLSILLYKNFNKHYSIRFFYIITIHNLIFLFFNNMFLYLPIMGQLIVIIFFFIFLNNIFNKYFNKKNIEKETIES